MQYTDIVYSNARVKTLENSLINSDRLNRIINSDNLFDAVKVLNEINYGDGSVISDPNNYDILIKAEDCKLINTLKEIIPEKTGAEILLYEQDAKNLKSCMKIKYSKFAKKEDLLLVSGIFDIDNMYESIMQDNYDKFPKHIAKALVDIDYEFALGQKRPAYIDYTIEKAINKTCLDILSKKADKKLIRFYKDSIEFTNFSTFLRSKKMNLTFKTFQEMFLEGGESDLSLFEKNYDQNLEQLQEIFKYKKAGKVFVDAINELKENGSLITFEKERDDYLISIFLEDRNEIFSVGPIVSYYLYKKLEIKMVKLALVNLNNNLDKKEFSKRLRACFKD